VHQFRSLKTPEARTAFERADADLGLLAYVTQIVPEPLLQIPRQASLCFHPSLLPRYRGGSAIPWQLIRGETRTGVTVFWPDAGIDTGPILLQRDEAIGPDDTAGRSTTRSSTRSACARASTRSAWCARGRAPRVPQDEALATYDPLLTDAHAAIDWTRPVATVHDLIRGCDPQPGAHTSFAGTASACTTRTASTAPGAGTVLAVDAAGITIAAQGGAVRCARARDGGAKAAAADVARGARHRRRRAARVALRGIPPGRATTRPRLAPRRGVREAVAVHGDAQAAAARARGTGRRRRRRRRGRLRPQLRPAAR
jgi:methionyl-tRNA formyltransferase